MFMMPYPDAVRLALAIVGTITFLVGLGVGFIVGRL